jgi:hypothetical protein
VPVCLHPTLEGSLDPSAPVTCRLAGQAPVVFIGATAGDRLPSRGGIAGCRLFESGWPGEKSQLLSQLAQLPYGSG